MKVGDLMLSEPIRLHADTKVGEAARLLTDSGHAGLPVVDDQGRYLGMVTSPGLLKALLDPQADTLCVKSVMAPRTNILSSEQRVSQLEAELLDRPVRCFAVVDESGHLAGTVSKDVLLTAFARHSGTLACELKSILESLQNGVVIVDTSSRIVTFNQAAERITGIKAEDALGRSVIEVFPDTQLLKVLHTGKAEAGQLETIGNSNVMITRTPIIAEDKMVGAISIFQDVTEIHELTGQLETVSDLKTTLETILETAFEGMVIVDREGRITVMNKAYGEFLGVDPVAAIGRHVTEVIENTRMHVVVETGKAELVQIQQIRNKKFVVSRVPILKDGKIVGAFGYVVFRDISDLKNLANRVNLLEKEAEYLKEELRRVRGAKYSLENIIGESPQIKALKESARRVAKGVSNVLVLGESGTGKELFAHAIHDLSERCHGPFVKLNCAALPEQLLESELFGYEEGAFTGAKKGGKPGKFELANGGTIFLDEIGEMPLGMQAKILRVLQEREFERVGGTRTLHVDVRLVAATNRDMSQMVREGKFRQDLFYRLNVISLNVPPLRERMSDLPLLVKHLLAKLNQQCGTSVQGVSDEAMACLIRHAWPGNVRELENVIERALNMSPGPRINLQHLPSYLGSVSFGGTSLGSASLGSSSLESGVLGTSPNSNFPVHDGQVLWDAQKSMAEREALLRALEAAGGNKSKASRILGMNRSWFYQKLKKYGLMPESIINTNK